ncbi:hypothetical protein DSM43276_03268 [Mycobacteroides salmoniphilum]|nr:hypothetical protein DSM43276_03268 [Mycobacteroides salmoniphilum]
MATRVSVSPSVLMVTLRVSWQSTRRLSTDWDG